MANGNKRTNRQVKVSKGKSTKKIENAQAYLTKNPVWKFNKADFDHHTWNIESCDILTSEILRKLKNFESMTWQEIQSASGGRRKGTNNHFIAFDDMIKEAQARAKELNILEYEELFSLRLKGEERLFGILTDGVFNLIWYDESHQICPSVKR